jgi:parallel beta-helix repeat protein
VVPVKSKSKPGWLVFGTCILMLTGAFSPLNAAGEGTGNFPAPSGTDWTISNDTHVWNETIVLDGNLIVTSGGNLTLENVTILFNCSSNGQYRLEVMNGGLLHVSDINGTPSAIASNTTYAYKFWIQNGASADIYDTIITDCGYDSWNGGTNNNTGLWINSPNVTISDCNISDNYIGAYIYNTTSVSIYSSLFSSNTYGLYINDSKDLVIAGNIIEACSESGIYVDSTGYNTIQHNNMIFCDDFNDGDLSDWNISTTGSGVMNTSNEHYISADKSLYMDAPGSSKAFARSPKFSFDDDHPYNLSSYFYLPQGNDHWVYVICNGQIRCVIDYGGDVKTVYDGSSHLIKTLNIGAWYNIRFDAHPINATYDVFIDGSYCQTAEFDEADSWDEIQLGDDTEDGSNYGSMYWDDINLSNSTTSIVYNTYNIDINNNQINDCGCGIYAKHSVFVNATSNQITNCTYGIKAKEATPLTNSNTITNSTTGIAIEDGLLYEGEVTGERECTVDTEGSVSIEVPGGAEIIDASFDITGQCLEKEKVINHTTFNDSEVAAQQSINTSDGEIKLMDSDTWAQTTYADFNTDSVLSNVDINSSQGDVKLNTVEQLDQSNVYSPNAYNALWNSQYIGQSFIPSKNGWCTQVDLMIYKIGNPSVNLEIRIFATSNGLPTGAALASKSVAPGDVGSTSGVWRTFTFSNPATLTLGTKYAVCAWSTSTQINNAYGWQATVSNTGYTPGTLVYSTNQGSSWSNAGYDNPFKTYVKYYYSIGYMTSKVFDTYGTSDWGTVSWSSNVPSGTSLVIKSRSGDCAVPDGHGAVG